VSRPWGFSGVYFQSYSRTWILFVPKLLHNPAGPKLGLLYSAEEKESVGAWRFEIQPFCAQGKLQSAKGYVVYVFPASGKCSQYNQRILGTFALFPKQSLESLQFVASEIRNNPEGHSVLGPMNNVIAFEPPALTAAKAAPASSEMPAKISFLRPVAWIALATRMLSNALTDERSARSPGLAVAIISVIVTVDVLIFRNRF
jgi:hypothetical protein